MSQNDKRYLVYYSNEFEDLLKDLDITINCDGKHLSEDAISLLRDIREDTKVFKNQIRNILEGKPRTENFPNPITNREKSEIYIGESYPPNDSNLKIWIYPYENNDNQEIGIVRFHNNKGGWSRIG